MQFFNFNQIQYHTDGDDLSLGLTRKGKKILQNRITHKNLHMTDLMKFPFNQLQELGGWANGDVIIPVITDYAKVLFEQFGDRVKVRIEKKL